MSSKSITDKPFALLIAPPIYDFALYDLFLKPYSLLRIGKWMSDNGYDVELINSLDYNDPETLLSEKAPKRKPNGTGKFFRTRTKTPDECVKLGKYLFRYGISKESLAHKIAQRKPDIVLVATGMTYWYYGVCEAIQAVREIWPDVPVAAGGVYATLMPDHCAAASGADFVITGDAQKEAGGLNDVLTKLRLPSCSKPWDDTMLMHPCLKDAAVIRINKGCPGRCRYCASRLISSFESGTAESAFAKVDLIHRTYGTKNFAFYDDALLVKKEEVFVPFLKMVLASGYDLNFYLPNAVHLDSLDPKTTELMFRAGFKEIRIGFESNDVKFHQKNDNKLDITTFPEKVEMLFKCGFTKENLGIYTVAGLPGQEAVEIEETLRYLAKYGLRGNIAEFSAVPGIALWDECVKKSIFPLETEPLYHNNTVFPMQWEKFTMADMARLKALSKAL